MAFPADGQSFFFFFQAGVMRQIQLSGIRPGVAVRMSARRSGTPLSQKDRPSTKGDVTPCNVRRENYTRACAPLSPVYDGRGCVEDGGRIFQKGTDD